MNPVNARFLQPANGHLKLTYRVRLPYQHTPDGRAGGSQGGSRKRNGKPLHLNPKKLRKSFITWQAERGFATSLIQMNVGHALGSPVTAKNYTHHSAEALRVAVLDLGQTPSPVRQRTRGLLLEEPLVPASDAATDANFHAPNLAANGSKKK